MASTWARGVQGLIAAAAVTGLLALGGCGGSDDGGADDSALGDDSGDSASFGPTLTVTFDFSGETTVKGSSTTSAPTNNGISPQTCADYAKGSAKDNGKTYYVLPSLLADKVGGRNLLLAAMLTEYNGPGDYGLDSVSGQGTPGGIEVDNRPYVIQSVTKGNVVTDNKGGGTWNFTRLAFNDGSGESSPGINGKVSWTCKE